MDQEITGIKSDIASIEELPVLLENLRAKLEKLERVPRAPGLALDSGKFWCEVP